MLDHMLQNMTTAECRKAALNFERDTMWFCAALCYDAAISRHPGNPKSRMYQQDISRLAERAASCYASAEWEAKEVSRFQRARDIHASL